MALTSEKKQAIIKEFAKNDKDTGSTEDEKCKIFDTFKIIW